MRKKIIFSLSILSFLGFIIGGINVEARTSKKIVPISSKIPNYEYPRVNELEKLILGKTYERDDLNARLNRLEARSFRETYPELSYDERIDKLARNYEKNLGGKIDLIKLSNIESKVLGRNYAYEDANDRIVRIETKMFGASQSGNLKDRFDLIEHASKDYSTQFAQANSENDLSNNENSSFSMMSNGYSQGYQDPYGTCYQNYPNSYSNSYPYGTNYQTGFWNGLKNRFYGNPTGYTPSLSNNYYYNPHKSYNRYNHYHPRNGTTQYSPSNIGDYYYSTNVGSTTGVTILD